MRSACAARACAFGNSVYNRRSSAANFTLMMGMVMLSIWRVWPELSIPVKNRLCGFGSGPSAFDLTGVETVSQSCHISGMAKHPKRPRDPAQLAKSPCSNSQLRIWPTLRRRTRVSLCSR
jgi:hypothetical protein